VIQHLLVLSLNQVVQILYSSDGDDPARSLDLGDADFGKSNVANLSFPLKVPQQAELILGRYVRIDTMQLKQLDTLKS
jgi:hypothetical protein